MELMVSSNHIVYFVMNDFKKNYTIQTIALNTIHNNEWMTKTPTCNNRNDAILCLLDTLWNTQHLTAFEHTLIIFEIEQIVKIWNGMADNETEIMPTVIILSIATEQHISGDIFPLTFGMFRSKILVQFHKLFVTIKFLFDNFIWA